MEVKDVFRRIRQIINENVFVDLYPKEWKKWRKIFLDFICAAEMEDELTLFDKRSDIERFIECTKEILLFNALDKNTRQTIRELLVFLYNINKNAERDEEIERDILLCIKIIDLCLTLNELIGVSREVITKMRQTLLYAPPAFELAPHYLKTMLEDIESSNE